MAKPSKEEFDLVIEAVRYEYKNHPLNLQSPTILNMAQSFASRRKRKGVHILLDITKHTELKDIPQGHIRSVINSLELSDKILENHSPHTYLPSEKPFTIPTSNQIDPLRFVIQIYDSFDNWYAAYQLKKNRKLENFDLKHIENIYKIVKEIDEKLQLNPSPEVIIPLHISISLGRGATRNIVRKGNEEYGEDILNYLEDEGVILYYTKEAYKDYPEALIIKLDINEFVKFNLEAERIYNEKFGNKLQTKPTSPIPAGVKWQDITIKFVNGHDVKIKIKDKTLISDFKQMGFEDTKRRLPNQQWKLLEQLSANNGEISWNNSEATVKLKKRKQLLSQALKTYFSIDEDPFFPYKQEKAYKIKIYLIPA